MAAPLSASIEAIPRFLLPRLGSSWTASSLARPSIAATWNTTQRNTYNTSAISKFARQNWAARRTSPPPAPQQHSNPNPTGRRTFTQTRQVARDHHFDTLKFVQRLKDEGFSEEQAVAMMKVLGDVIEESIQNLTRTMVLREDQEKATYTQKVDFAKLRSELLSADSSESSLTRGSHERLTNDLAKLNSRLRDEVQRTQASVRLDLNLEKGRIREEANNQDLKIQETEARIEQESAALRERLEAVKFSTLQWLMGVCTGTAAIILGVWRLLM
ncbi:Hypothetical protein R9X50_00660100 [Acrodontium crateriforme]|uniref:DUF1640-domain-containing protein n=1 Tax=Acrodontium crateriforme TaxID=150365 RepID=A0AAQ3RDP6_9PEZI|nr:Hypothetical protein R9X50_00660100 [Acrodontium crateriforme]